MLDTHPTTPYTTDATRSVHPLHIPRQAAALSETGIASRVPGCTLMGGGVRTAKGKQ